jgi:hypothetical protein
MTKVITFSAPSGASINVTPAQERALRKAKVWPRTSRGEEYCQVFHGLHAGEPTYGDNEIVAAGPLP